MDKKIFITALAGAAAIFASCDRNQAELPEPSFEAKSGFYILNEGGYGAENASLDFCDFTTQTYVCDVFAAQNGFNLGAVANSIISHEDLLLIAVNGTGVVRFLDAATAIQIAEADVPNCRQMTVVGDWLYVSSFADNGTVYKISLKDYSVEAKVATGYDPEEMLYRDGYLYVLNSGGYHGYSDTISVIDLQDFSVERTISTGYKNLNMILVADNSVYVSAWGNYSDDPGAVFSIDLDSGATNKIADFSVSNWCGYNGSIYWQSTAYDTDYKAVHSFGKITGTALDSDCINVPSDLVTPYGIDAHPATGDLVITDAKDYASAGSIYYFDASGELAWSHEAGVCPARVAWIGF